VTIINNEKFTDHNKYSKDGLNLLTVEKYKAQNKKSEVDMLFMAATASVLGEKSPETSRHQKQAGGGHRKNVSVLSYHNILKDIPEESPGFRSKRESARDSLINIQSPKDNLKISDM
jgi:hypothetical protein